MRSGCDVPCCHALLPFAVPGVISGAGVPAVVPTLKPKCALCQGLWVVAKDRRGSPQKVDAAVAAVLSWEGRRAALATPPEPEYSSGQWDSSGHALSVSSAAVAEALPVPEAKVDRATYIPCRRCKKTPIHPSRHADCQHAQGLCMRCRRSLLLD
jgi:hypothetical protein